MTLYNLDFIWILCDVREKRCGNIMHPHSFERWKCTVFLMAFPDKLELWNTTSIWLKSISSVNGCTFNDENPPRTSEARERKGRVTTQKSGWQTHFLKLHKVLDALWHGSYLRHMCLGYKGQTNLEGIYCILKPQHWERKSLPPASFQQSSMNRLR